MNLSTIETTMKRRRNGMINIVVLSGKVKTNPEIGYLVERGVTVTFKLEHEEV